MLKGPHRHPHDPTGHGVQPQRHGDGRRDLSHRQRALRPDPERRANHQRHGGRVEQRHRRLLIRKQPHQRAKTQTMATHRALGETLLPRGMGEKFDRLDIRVTVHDPARDAGIRGADLLRRLPRLGREPQDKAHKPGDPERQRHRQPPVHP